MKKISIALSGLAVLFGSMIPVAFAADTGARLQAAQQVQPVLASFAGQLILLQNQLAIERQWMIQAQAQLGTIAASLRTLAQSRMETAEERNAVAQVVASTNLAVSGMASQMTAIQTRRVAQVSILTELTQKFSTLVSLVLQLPR